MSLRFAELVSACVVAGIIGAYLDAFDKASTWPEKRFIYVEVVAGVSVLLSLMWLCPFAAGFLPWPTGLVFSAAWFAAFGLLVNFLDYNDCSGSTFGWGGDHSRWSMQSVGSQRSL
jgi:hypothetical protein